MSMGRGWAALFIAVLLLAGEAAAAQEQPTQSTSRGRGHGAVQVAIVAVDAPWAPRAEVVRRATFKPRDVVLLSAQATDEDLAGALKLLAALRYLQGDSLPQDVRAKVTSATPPPTWFESEYRRWINVQLERLREAREYNVAGLGVGRAIRVTLPEATGKVVVADTSRMR